MTLSEIILITSSIIVVCSVIYYAVKAKNYKNDERGQLILAKANGWSLSTTCIIFLVSLFVQYTSSSVDSYLTWSKFIPFLFLDFAFLSQALAILIYEKKM